MEDVRVSARAGTALAALLAVTVLSASAALAAGAVPDISGTYWITQYNMKLQLADGSEPPLNDAGRALYAKNQAGLQDGSITDAARRFCVPDGIPRVLANPYPFEIIQAPPGQTTIVYELNHQIRVIAMDKPLPSDMELIPFPFYNGHSVGHFEGDTLVIESAGFNEKTFLDATGLPHSDQLKTVERVRKIAGNQLEDVVTITDPVNYTRPFSARFVYNQRNEIRLEDYVCGEEHRDISGIPGVAAARAANASRAPAR
jgi:hypothetical protein